MHDNRVDSGSKEYAGVDFVTSGFPKIRKASVQLLSTVNWLMNSCCDEERRMDISLSVLLLRSCNASFSFAINPSQALAIEQRNYLKLKWRSWRTRTWRGQRKLWLNHCWRIAQCLHTSLKANFFGSTPFDQGQLSFGFIFIVSWLEGWSDGSFIFL